MNCECHGEPLIWAKRNDRPSGGTWLCTVKLRKRNQAYEQRHPAKRAQKNAQRIRVGGMYLGTIGFTQQEREDIVNGSPK
jgi:hypothetical protein